MHLFLRGLISRCGVLLLALVFSRAGLAEPLLSGPLVATTTTLRGMSPAEQADALAEMGYESLWANAGREADVGKLRAYFEAPAVTEGRIGVDIVRWTPRVGDAYDAAKSAALYGYAAEQGLPLWVYLQGDRGARSEAIAFYRQAATHAQRFGVDVVIYPHVSSPIANASEAYEVIQQVGLSNLKLSILWCHELKTGQHTKIADTINEMAPLVAIVAVHGADSSMEGRRGWSRTIMPLDQGDLSPRPMLEALSRAGYDGPVLLKTYGIQDPPAEHLSRSLAAWQAMNRVDDSGVTAPLAAEASGADRARAAALLASGKRYEFGAFDMGSLGQLPPAEQAELLVALGYDAAIATGWHKPNVDYIEKWFSAPAVTDGRLHLPAALWTAAITDEYDRPRMDRLLAVLRDNDAMLWVKGRGNKRKLPQAPAFYQRLADHAAEYGVTVVLYPHHRTTYLDAEEALELLHKVDRPNVKLSMHFCHELKESNDDRIPEIVGLVHEHLALVSINGADSSMDRVSGDWSRTIMPLDEGDLDPTPMVRALLEHGYAGPVFLHTYGVDQEPRDHLSRSMARWREVEAAARDGSAVE